MPGIVEKPKPSEAPSDLAIVGRYVLTPDIFPVLGRDAAGRRRRDPAHRRPGPAPEAESLYACRFKGERFDIGRPLGFSRHRCRWPCAGPTWPAAPALPPIADLGKD